ncbi:outer membrane MltA-interaction protein MipA [Thalassotalea profundi]|uniref:Outer membrane MltA-interaction protein MipA n=1 Tax=Thalassotalea profundi TaxID=2036687 RepID=A0ABQ3IPJ8_9GAMM|nr:outer membrane MltA-interaction protein MipA [Thalassotalea profundi]
MHTNPLNGGDNIPLFIVPSVSYYGENLFFDNGTLGYSFTNNHHLVISAISEFNLEKSFFSRWHPQNIFMYNLSAASPSKENVNIAQVDNKRWALDAGIQINWFMSSATNISVKLLHDINGVYNGYNANVSLNSAFNIPYSKNTSINVGVGAQVNSENLVDYYYGIEESNNFYARNTFHGSASVNPIIRIKLSKTINKQWRLLFNWKRTFLDSNTADSPLVKTHLIDTVFFGMEYAF